jgi:hypothetical protein
VVPLLEAEQDLCEREVPRQRAVRPCRVLLTRVAVPPVLSLTKPCAVKLAQTTMPGMLGGRSLLSQAVKLGVPFKSVVKLAPRAPTLPPVVRLCTAPLDFCSLGTDLYFCA